MELAGFRDFRLSFLMIPYVDIISMQSTLFRSSSFRFLYKSCRRDYLKGKSFRTAVTHNILAVVAFLGEKKNAISTKIVFWVDFLMRKETGEPEENHRFRLTPTETQAMNNCKDERRDRQPYRQCDSRDFR